ncbi:hypothetical protein K438DRAFT_1780729 [Mycena galopus ATCC 62051]|nr:hypothetical protein K438DRAFT_1780729 [Mycena galopus ATCC 62051]
MQTPTGIAKAQLPFLAQRASNGHDVNGLTEGKVKLWLTKGWYTSFHGCYNENPKAVREVPHSSTEELSDLEENLHADYDDNVNASDDKGVAVEGPKVSLMPMSKIAKKGVTNPCDVKPLRWSRSKPTSCTHPVKVKKEERLHSLSTYLEGRTRVDEEAMKIAQEDASFKRLKAAEGMAKKILADDTGKYSVGAKVKASLVLERLMDAALGI